MNLHAESSSVPRIPYRMAPVVFFALLAAILAITWPWAESFATAVLKHWDPPFHAWKLELVARSILSGHLLPPDGNTNMYYPHPGALYYEALHWPQALFAAPFFALPDANPVLIYHLTLVFFWALSGVCMWMMLSALGVSQRAAWLGAWIFTLMPYRTSYMVEFNMQLNFALPLFFFFWIRYFQRPSIRYACGMGLAWFLQASSELYQAVFLLLFLPFPALAFIAAQEKVLFTSVRKFWIPLLCAGVLAGVLTWTLLGPYLTLLNAQSVHRALEEIATHVLSPLSYFRTKGFFNFGLPLHVRIDEMLVYPTWALLILAAGYMLYLYIRQFQGARPALLTVLFCRLRDIALLLFFALTVLFYFYTTSMPPRPLVWLYGILPVVAVCAALCALWDARRTPLRLLFLRGCFAGAIFAFFMGFGPEIQVRNHEFLAQNHLFRFFYSHLSAMHGFRVVSRFSIFVLFFLILAAVLGWDEIEKRWLRNRWLKSLWLLPAALVFLESIPAPFKMVDLQYPLDSEVIRSLDKRGEPFVLAILPMGNRSHDSRHMLQIAQTKYFSVYAWGGAYPPYTRAVAAAMLGPEPKVEKAAALLRQLWPECLLLEDKFIARRGSTGCNFKEAFAGVADVLQEDQDFVLMRLHPAAATNEYIRLIRPDVLRDNPILTFSANTTESTADSLIIDANGYPLGAFPLSGSSETFVVPIPPRLQIQAMPDRIRFRTIGDAPFLLENLQFQPAGDAAALSTPDTAIACPPWVGHLHQLPPEALPFPIHYGRRMEILGVEVPSPQVHAGDSLVVHYFVKLPRNLRALAGSSLVTRIRPDQPGKWFEHTTSALDGVDLADVLCQAHPALYRITHAIPIPETLAPGDYTLSAILKDKQGHVIKGAMSGKRAKRHPLPLQAHVLPPPSTTP